MFSYELCETFKNNFFTEHLQATDSGIKPYRKFRNMSLVVLFSLFMHHSNSFNWLLEFLRTIAYNDALLKMFLLLIVSSLFSWQREKNYPSSKTTLHKKWSFPLRTSSVNVTKFAVSLGFSHIYWRNPYGKTSFFGRCILLSWTVQKGTSLVR